MEKDMLLETLKSNKMCLTLREIEEMMDEELNKPPEEMDTELVDLCVDVLLKAYAEIDKRKSSEESKVKLKRKIALKRIALVAAILMILLCISIPIVGGNVRVDDSKDLIKSFNGRGDDYFSLDLENGETKADKHSDENIDIIKELKSLGLENAVLPKVLLEDDYTTSVRQGQNDERVNILLVSFSSKKRKTEGVMDITIFKNGYNSVTDGNHWINEKYNFGKRILINGMDVIIFSNNKESQIIYIDTNNEYNMRLSSCDFDTAVKIAEALAQ